jgi:hypothetical protein
MRTKTVLAIVAPMLLSAPSALAQQASPPPAGASPTPAASAPAPDDGGRFRFGIDGTVGNETVSASGISVSGLMYGLDLRLGWQVNNLLGIYTQPHLSFGSLSTTSGSVPVSGATGTIVATVMGEITLIDRIFIAAGPGYGILNNPSGLAIEARAGGYPLMGKSDTGPRRKGLSLAVDFRSVFVSGATGTLIMGCIGYDAF